MRTSLPPTSGAFPRQRQENQAPRCQDAPSARIRRSNIVSRVSLISASMARRAAFHISGAQRRDDVLMGVFLGFARAAQHHETGKTVVQASEHVRQLLVAGRLGNQAVKTPVFIGVPIVGLVVISRVACVHVLQFVQNGVGHLLGGPFDRGQFEDLAHLEQLVQLFEGGAPDEIPGAGLDGDQPFLAEHLKGVAQGRDAAAVGLDEFIQAEALTRAPVPHDDGTPQLPVGLALGRAVDLCVRHGCPSSDSRARAQHTT